MNLNNVLVGTDPEAFVRNKETKEIVSAIGFIPGSKDDPFNIGKGCAIQTDNVMVEFCVPASNNSKDLYESIQFSISDINNRLEEAGLEVVIIASSTLDRKYLENKQAQTFGCDPDFNVYTLQINEAPDSRGDLRSAGGHIHVGYEDPSFEMNLKIVRAMDLFLGIPSIVLDEDTERKKMYGKAGAYREKPYGIEYRVLSNFWIESQKKVDWAVSQTLRAVDFAANEDWIDDVTSMEIQLAINNQDIELACKLAKKFDVLLDFQVQYLVKQ